MFRLADLGVEPRFKVAPFHLPGQIGAGLSCQMERLRPLLDHKLTDAKNQEIGVMTATILREIWGYL